MAKCVLLTVREGRTKIRSVNTYQDPALPFLPGGPYHPAEGTRIHHIKEKDMPAGVGYRSKRPVRTKPGGKTTVRSVRGVKTRTKKPVRPIGPGKKGSGKRLIYKTGGGEAALRTFRSMPKGTRKALRKESEKTGRSLTKTVRSIRSQRKARGSHPTTGAARPRRVKLPAKLPSKRIY